MSAVVDWQTKLRELKAARAAAPASKAPSSSVRCRICGKESGGAVTCFVCMKASMSTLQQQKTVSSFASRTRQLPQEASPPPIAAASPAPPAPQHVLGVTAPSTAVPAGTSPQPAHEPSKTPPPQQQSPDPPQNAQASAPLSPASARAWQSVAPSTFPQEPGSRASVAHGRKFSITPSMHFNADALSSLAASDHAATDLAQQAPVSSAQSSAHLQPPSVNAAPTDAPASVPLSPPLQTPLSPPTIPKTFGPSGTETVAPVAPGARPSLRQAAVMQMQQQKESTHSSSGSTSSKLSQQELLSRTSKWGSAGPRLSPQAKAPSTVSSLSVPGGQGAPTMAAAAAAHAAKETKDANWRKTRMKSIRQSRMVMTNQLGSILERVSSLEKVIVATEAARQLAEDNIIEIAIAKMEEDERVVKLAGQLSDIIAAMQRSEPGDHLSRLVGVRDALISNCPPDRVPPASSDSPSPSAATTPPPPPMMRTAPPPVKMMTSPPPLRVQAQTGDGSQKNALLDSIRRGQKLRKLDVDALRQERKESLRHDSRKSVMMVKSLEDTIRGAIMTKFAFDDDDEEDEDVWQ